MTSLPCVVFNNYPELNDAYKNERLGADPTKERCYICYENFQNEKKFPCFGHEKSDGKIWHLLHMDCKRYTLIHEKCAVCQDSLNVDAISSVRKSIFAEVQECSFSLAKQLLSTAVPIAALSTLINQVTTGYLPEVQLGAMLGGWAMGYETMIQFLYRVILTDSYNDEIPSSRLQYLIDVISAYAPVLIIDAITNNHIDAPFYCSQGAIGFSAYFSACTVIDYTFRSFTGRPTLSFNQFARAFLRWENLALD